MTLLICILSKFHGLPFIFPITIILISSFTHIWNPIGFPTINIDEGIYMLRAVQILYGNENNETIFYDHPYFGPIVLASLLKVIDYPNIASPNLNEMQSFELLYLFPRVWMGILGVLDTMLIYFIAKYRYNRNVGLIASLLFAAMPLTWITRRIYLESLLLPFLLSSILLLLFISNKYPNQKKFNIIRNVQNHPAGCFFKPMIIVSSGVLFGLAIFTKIPVVSMVPLAIFLIYHITKRVRQVSLFMLPVVAIPLIWPLSAIHDGEFDRWSADIMVQLNRSNGSISNSFYEIYLIDPVLLILSLAGFVVAVFKKDLFLLMWLLPFLFFFGFVIDYVQWFHLIPLIGLFCISSAVFLEYLLIHLKKLKVFLTCVIAFVLVFGLCSTIILISTNVSSFQFHAMAFVGQKILESTIVYPNSTNSSTTNNNDVDDLIQKKIEPVMLKEHRSDKTNKTEITIVSSPIYSWIFKDIFNYSNSFSSYTENKRIESNMVILAVDRYFRDYLMDSFSQDSMETDDKKKNLENLFKEYAASEHLIYFRGNTINFDLNQYPFTSMKHNFGGSPIDIRANY